MNHHYHDHSGVREALLITQLGPALPAIQVALALYVNHTHSLHPPPIICLLTPISPRALQQKLIQPVLGISLCQLLIHGLGLLFEASNVAHLTNAAVWGQSTGVCVVVDRLVDATIRARRLILHRAPGVLTG